MTMTPVAVFPTLDANYELVSVERREMTSGQRVTYLDAQGAVMDPNAAPALAPTPEPTASPDATVTPTPTASSDSAAVAASGSAGLDSTTDAATSAASTDSLADTGTSMNVVGMVGLALVAMAAALRSLLRQSCQS
jgi:hypothetical protein